MDDDPHIGATLPVKADHAGHTVTVVRRDIAKHLAYWCRCSCGREFLLGEHWVKEYQEKGYIPHGSVS